MFSAHLNRPCPTGWPQDAILTIRERKINPATYRDRVTLGRPLAQSFLRGQRRVAIDAPTL
jgi:hypothetical protein